MKCQDSTCKRKLLQLNTPEYARDFAQDTHLYKIRVPGPWPWANTIHRAPREVGPSPCSKTRLSHCGPFWLLKGFQLSRPVGVLFFKSVNLWAYSTPLRRPGLVGSPEIPGSPGTSSSAMQRPLTQAAVSSKKARYAGITLGSEPGHGSLETQVCPLGVKLFLWAAEAERRALYQTGAQV